MSLFDHRDTSGCMDVYTLNNMIPGSNQRERDGGKYQAVCAGCGTAVGQSIITIRSRRLNEDLTSRGS